MSRQADLGAYGIRSCNVHRNLSPAELYEHAIRYDGAEITASGALASYSGEKKGRSPKDKRIVDERPAGMTSGGAKSISLSAHNLSRRTVQRQLTI